MKMNLSGADVDTPRAAATYAAGLATVLNDMSREAGLAYGNQDADGVGPGPLAFWAAQQDAYATAAAAAQAAADRANDQCSSIGDTIGSDDSLAGTQAGGYADPAAL